MNRPSQDQYFMEMARLVASRSNCYRRQVGCVMVDAENRVLSTGYNGVPRDLPHCEPGKCPRENKNPGSNLHQCLAVHSEINALIQAANPDKIFKVYVTHSPCLNCTVALLNTLCYEIIFDHRYPSDGLEQKLWEDMNRIWRQHR